MISKLLDLTSSICPFPHIINHIKIDGVVFEQPKICQRCEGNFCEKQDYQSNSILSCPKGVNFYQLMVVDEIVTINGIFVLGFCRKFSRKEKKETLNIIREIALTTWVSKSKEMTKSLESAVKNSVETTLGMLHDVKTAVSTIFRNAESLIYDEPGATLDEKIENAPQAKKKLFKSVSLLEERLKMMSLVSNPEAARHGGRKPVPVYKVFDKTMKIFHNIANQKNIKLNLNGHSFSSPRLFTSFSTIPLVLIDNAIKYSLPDQEITVVINDTNGGVSVQVESYSLRINARDSKKIFKKNFRAKDAHKVAVEGSGLGLYLADIVASANGFEINHAEKGNSHVIDRLSYVNNIFSFYISNS